MGELRLAVPKPSKAGAGAPTPKYGLATLIYVEDILNFPLRDAKGVLMVGNIVLVANAVMHTIYLTPSSQKLSYTVEGDEDMEGFLPKAEGTVPGSVIETHEFVQNALGQGFVLIFGKGCGDNTGKVLGSPCNPMKLKPEFVDDKDGTKTTMVFEQTVKSSEIPGFYFGEVQYAANNEVADAAAISLLKASGTVYQLPEDAAGAAAAVAAMDHDNGTILSLIGGGGADPTTLDGGVSGPVTIVLLNGTQWVALENAVINFEVVKGGATTYLIERSRSA